MGWDQDTLAGMGYVGFVPLATLEPKSVPPGPGTYALIRPSTTPPTFLDELPYPHTHPRDRDVPVEKLETAWVDGTTVVYLGKASGLASRGLPRRLRQYRDHGAGRSKSHFGGRYIWQLADHDTLLVGWRPVGDEESAAHIEAAHLAAFAAAHGGNLPFANLVHGATTH